MCYSTLFYIINVINQTEVILLKIYNISPFFFLLLSLSLSGVLSVFIYLFLDDLI